MCCEVWPSVSFYTKKPKQPKFSAKKCERVEQKKWKIPELTVWSDRNGNEVYYLKEQELFS